MLLLFGAAWLSAGLLTWLLYSATSSAKQAKMVKVMAASRDLSAGTRLRKGDLKLASLPERELPKGVFLDEKALFERTLLFPVSAGEPILQVKLASVAGAEGVPATIPPGKRAVGVQVSDSTSAAGLIQPRAHVDVIYTRTGSLNEAVSKVILEDVQVLSVGRVTEVTATDPKAAAAAATSTSTVSATQQRAVTILVNAEDVPKLELARNNGKIGLVLRNPLDAGKLGKMEPTYADELDPYLGARKDRLAKTQKLNPVAARAVNNDRAWADLTAKPKTNPAEQKKAEKRKEEETLRATQRVVDVYRGDKHVLEVFEKNK